MESVELSAVADGQRRSGLDGLEATVLRPLAAGVDSLEADCSN